VQLTRKTFLGLVVGTWAALWLPVTRRRCRTCGAPTDVHLIDCTRELGGKERARTLCFQCTPEARVIDKYWTGFAAVMHARKNNVNCSECGVGPGYIHPRDREFDYRLCAKCGPDAANCRRWVRDLRG
jgi:hypothetical protein